jgi:signal transduction histidine kinase
MPSKRSLGRRHTFCISLDFGQIDFFTSSCPFNFLWADPTHLNRLWLVLLDNAMKYTPLGGQVTITILCSSGGAPICEIADNGIGIAANDLPNIFERFFRAENARLVADSGSGLGLAIARWIADVHHAQIDVESIHGGGSIFRVMFQASMEIPRPDGSRNEATRLMCPLPRM